jgi:hypothetical protein
MGTFQATENHILQKLLTVLLAAVALTAMAQDPAQLPPEKKVALKTTSGYYITAENGGGLSVNTDRQELGPWETFTMVPVGPGVFAFRTDKGTYLCDLAGETRGGRTSRSSLGASKKQVDPSTQFKLMILNPDGPVVALVTAAGKYVTAESNGGVKARGARAMSTDRTDIGAWEQLLLVDLDKQPK